MRIKKTTSHHLHSTLWRWFVYSAYAVVMIFILSFGWRLSRVWNQRTWFGVEPYRLLILHGKRGEEPTALELITLWPDNFKMVSLSIPPELRVVTVGGYGTYRIAALVNLGRIEGVGDRLLNDSVSLALGVPIHQLLWQTNSNFDINPARWDLLQKGLIGNQSLKEVSEIITAMGNTSKNNIEKVDLSKRNVIKTMVEADGTLSLAIEPALIDHLMMEKISAVWKDAALTQVALINASGKPQMAALWSKFPRIGGYDVVSVTDQLDMVNQTQILFSDEKIKNGLVGLVLQRMFPRAQVSVSNTSNYRAQVAIILGLDSWQWLNERNEYLKKMPNQR